MELIKIITDPMEADGNFRALLRMRIRAGDASLSELIETSRNNAQYTSKTVQNALLSAAAELVQEALLERIRKAKLYTILGGRRNNRSLHSKTDCSCCTLCLGRHNKRRRRLH